MDTTLLIFFNQTLAHPILDGVMMGLTVAGFALLPVLGLALLFVPEKRKTGVAILVALLAGLILVVTFQYFGSRPRPEAVRLLIATPGFPSYPSGHAAAAFAVATVLGLTYRRGRWWGIVLAGATLIAFSRVYLGLHYPSDVLGGAILGAAVGAACFGLFGVPQPDWRWLLWPQVAVVMIVTHMAYLDLLSIHLLRWPGLDKVMHFLLFGTVVFWLNLWLNGRTVQVGQWAMPVAVLIPFAIAALEEGAQSFSPLRSANWGDLISDLAGMLFFWWLSRRFVSLETQSAPNIKGRRFTRLP